MPLPRPASPRVLWNDLCAFAAQRQRHEWAAGFVALLMPIAILTVFVLDSNSMQPGPRVIYVENYPATRTDDEIRAAQLVRQRQAAEREAETRRRWKQLGDRTGVNP